MGGSGRPEPIERREPGGWLEPGGQPERGVRVLIVDPQELFRRGLHLVLDQESGIDVVGEASDGEEAVARARELEPDVVLMEVRLPALDGGEAARSIMAPPVAASSVRVAEPRVSPKVLVLTSSDDEHDVYEAVRAGAAGYLLKDASVPDVADALRRVVRGHSPISPSIASKLLVEFSSLSRKSAGSRRWGEPTLTGREVEVLRLVARGMTNREVAAELFIAENTVKNHMRNILEKLKLHSRVQAVMYAVRERLIEPDGA